MPTACSSREECFSITRLREVIFSEAGAARSLRLVAPFLRDLITLPRSRNTSFIDKYVFPNGDLLTIAQAVQGAEAAHFEVRDVENLREHYELTLRCWVDGLRRNATALLKLVPETTYRIWLLYMAGCAAAFRRGDIAVFQTLLSRQSADAAACRSGGRTGTSPA